MKHDWVPIQTYAEKVGRDKETVRRWAHRGYIPSIRVGKITLVDRNIQVPASGKFSWKDAKYAKGV